MADGDQPAAPADSGAADLTPTQDDLDWGQANDEFAKSHDFTPGQPVKKTEVKKEGDENADKDKPAGTGADGAAKPGEEKPAASDSDKPADKDKKPEEGSEADADKDKQPEVPDDPDQRAYRQRQRELAADEEAIKSDIRKEMFSDRPTELLDADGDPIKTIEDVQKLTNPNTGKAFTEEEAGAWLLAAQKHLNEQREKDDKEIEVIAQANLDIRDWSQAVKAKFGEFIAANPDIWKPIWAEYQATLVKDEKTDYITKAPVNLLNFVEVALAPHLKLAEQMQQQTQQEQKDKQDKERKQSRADRSDIYAGGKTGDPDPEDEEWDQAAKEYYGTK